MYIIAKQSLVTTTTHKRSRARLWCRPALESTGPLLPAKKPDCAAGSTQLIQYLATTKTPRLVYCTSTRPGYFLAHPLLKYISLCSAVDKQPRTTHNTTTKSAKLHNGRNTGEQNICAQSTKPRRCPSTHLCTTTATLVHDNRNNTQAPQNKALIRHSTTT
jgi:hypothetical protein